MYKRQLLGRNKVEGWIQPTGLVFATSALNFESSDRLFFLSGIVWGSLHVMHG